MPLTAYPARDLFKYKPDERVARFSPDLEEGVYVFVQDCSGVVWVAPDGQHMHPKVLGGARPAVSAGVVTLGAKAEVLLIDNGSGTFRCGPDCLFAAIGGITAQGGKCVADAIVAKGK